MINILIACTVNWNKNKLNLTDPKYIDQLLHLAGSYRASGKFDSAKKTYQKIIEIDTTNTLALRLIIDYLDIQIFTL